MTLYVGVFDIVQYDCPVVQLTEQVKDSSVLVVGANVAEIRKGYERIYTVVLGNEETISSVLERIASMRSVKRYDILRRKKGYLKMAMVISKTYTMETAVDHDAIPLATWVALNGFERWTLGFHTSDHLREFVKRVSERDYIERYELLELPDHVLTINHVSLLSNLIGSLGKLTEKQVGLLFKALELGYYEWPRRTSISSLAREFGISRVAAAKILRRAEKNVVGATLGVLRERGIKEVLKFLRAECRQPRQD